MDFEESKGRINQARLSFNYQCSFPCCPLVPINPASSVTEGALRIKKIQQISWQLKSMRIKSDMLWPVDLSSGSKTFWQRFDVWHSPCHWITAYQHSGWAVGHYSRIKTEAPHLCAAFIYINFSATAASGTAAEAASADAGAAVAIIQRNKSERRRRRTAGHYIIWSFGRSHVLQRKPMLHVHLVLSCFVFLCILRALVKRFEI